MAKNSYYCHRKELLDHGIDLNLRPESTNKTNLAPLIRLLEAAPASIPVWAHQMHLVHPSTKNTGLRAVS